MAPVQGRITLWMIEVFAAVAETRSVSAAAKRLGASPSAVSQQLSNLDGALGVMLVDRGARPLILTPAGGVFLRRARNILDEAALARADLGDRNLAHLARFCLGMIEDFDADVTPRLLTEMAGALQECRFVLETGASHRLLDGLAARDLDIVVTADTGAIPQEMEVHPLLTEPFVAVLPAARGQGSAVPLDLSDVADLVPIFYTGRHHMGRLIAAHLARQDIRLAPRFEMDSYHAILSMIADGRGWSILSPLGLRRAQRFDGQVAVAPLSGPPLARRIVLAARRGDMGGLPVETARRLRTILKDALVIPAREAWPWLGDAIAVLPEAGDGAVGGAATGTAV